MNLSSGVKLILFGIILGAGAVPRPTTGLLSDISFKLWNIFTPQRVAQIIRNLDLPELLYFTSNDKGNEKFS
jgi:hypothetical protein